jgi:hypothetical protein
MHSFTRFHNAILKRSRRRSLGGLPTRDESRRDFDAHRRQLLAAERYQRHLY